MRRPIVVTVALVLLVSLGSTHTVSAQSAGETAAYVSGTAGASFGDGETALALAAGLGFRLARRLGVEFELAYARKLDFTLDLCPAPRVCVIGGELPVTGRTVSLVPHVTIELPASQRVRAYVMAGVGAGHVRQRYFLGPPFTDTFAAPVEFTRSKMAVALSVGGGLAVQISRRLAVGVDVRSLHLLDDEPSADRYIVPAGTLSTLRVGSRVTWRM